MLGQIMELSKKVNTEKRATIFVSYSGHVNWIEVNVHLNGWRSNSTPEIMMRAYEDSDEGLQKIIDTLQSIYNDEPQAVRVGKCRMCSGTIIDGDDFANFHDDKICMTCVQGLTEVLNDYQC